MRIVAIANNDNDDFDRYGWHEKEGCPTYDPHMIVGYYLPHNWQHVAALWCIDHCTNKWGVAGGNFVFTCWSDAAQYIRWCIDFCRRNHEPIPAFDHAASSLFDHRP